jgi:hypothetical protein
MSPVRAAHLRHASESQDVGASGEDAVASAGSLAQRFGEALTALALGAAGLDARGSGKQVRGRVRTLPLLLLVV